MTDGSQQTPEPDWLALVGRLVWLGALIELGLRQLLVTLLGRERTAAEVIAAGQDVGWLCNYSKSIAGAKGLAEPHLTTVVGRIEAARIAYADRNWFVHSLLLGGEDEDSRLLYRSMRATKSSLVVTAGITTRPVSHAQMGAILDSLEAASVGLTAATHLVDVHLNDAPPSAFLLEQLQGN